MKKTELPLHSDIGWKEIYNTSVRKRYRGSTIPLHYKEFSNSVLFPRNIHISIKKFLPEKR